MTIIRKQWRLKWFSMNGFFKMRVSVRVGERRAHLLNVSDDRIQENLYMFIQCEDNEVS